MSQQEPPAPPRNVTRLRCVIAVAAPIGIGAVVVPGWLVTHSFNLDYQREMWAAALLSLVAGVLAVVPLLLYVVRGPTSIVRCMLLVIPLRVVLMLAGLVLAIGPGWHLALVPLVLWMAACYVALLIAESCATAWAARHWADS